MASTASPILSRSLARFKRDKRQEYQFRRNDMNNFSVCFVDVHWGILWDYLPKSSTINFIQMLYGNWKKWTLFGEESRNGRLAMMHAAEWCIKIGNQITIMILDGKLYHCQDVNPFDPSITSFTTFDFFTSLSSSGRLSMVLVLWRRKPFRIVLFAEALTPPPVNNHPTQ